MEVSRAEGDESDVWLQHDDISEIMLLLKHTGNSNW
jgi:hypothetical protein